MCTWIAFGTSCVRATMENTISYKPEVETVPQTGTELSNENRYRRYLNGSTYILGDMFSLIYMPTAPDAFFMLNFNMADGYRK